MRLKDSVNAFALLLMVIAVCAIVMPLVSRGQGGNQNAPPHRTLRKFYLTPTVQLGNEALTACASGYHMASLWEILDVSNLQYDTSLGVARPDSGSGPPAFLLGWIRTGGESASNDEIGTSNCLVHTTAEHGHVGTTLYLPKVWRTSDPSETPVTRISPWVADPFPCDLKTNVWCVQD